MGVEIHLKFWKNLGIQILGVTSWWSVPSQRCLQEVSRKSIGTLIGRLAHAHWTSHRFSWRIRLGGTWNGTGFRFLLVSQVSLWELFEWFTQIEVGRLSYCLELISMVYLVLCIFLLYFSRCANSSNIDNERSSCIKYRDRYRIVPGESFGSLPAEMHNVYLSLRCYRFFCEPHPLSGRGKFKCVPLKEGQLMQE